MSAHLLRLRDAAEAFSVSFDLLYKGVKSEALPAIQPSREWLVEPAEVMAYLRRLHDEKVEADA